jgi:indolepyruvate ferredoxin oxidoreductase
MALAMRRLAPFKVLRGTPFDPFGATAERRDERRARDRYETLVDEIAAAVTPASYQAAVALAASYERVRGYGAIKRAAVAEALALESEARARFTAAQFAPARLTA